MQKDLKLLDVVLINLIAQSGILRKVPQHFGVVVLSAIAVILRVLEGLIKY